MKYAMFYKFHQTFDLWFGGEMFLEISDLPVEAIISLQNRAKDSCYMIYGIPFTKMPLADLLRNTP